MQIKCKLQNYIANYIHNNEADFRINSKTQFRQPAIPRVITTREPPGGDRWEGGGRRRAGRGGGGRRGQAEEGRRRQQGRALLFLKT